MPRKSAPMLMAATLLLSALRVTDVPAAGPETGPVIPDYGPVYAVPEGSFNLDPGQSYKVVMDVGKGPDDPAALNRGIESAARFLNMSARNGTDGKNLELAVVLHGSAGRAALTDEAHRAHFGSPNPNREMLEQLKGAGAEIYICGQTAAHRGFGPEQMLPQVTVAVSAMTVHVRLQQEGYRAILF